MSDKSSDMNKTQVCTTGPKAVLIITPDGRLEAGEGLSHDEVSRELFKICSTYYGTRTAELERENAALRADKERLDWLLTYEGGSWLYWAIENGEWTPEVAASRAAIDANRKEAQP